MQRRTFYSIGVSGHGDLHMGKIITVGGTPVIDGINSVTRNPKLFFEWFIPGVPNRARAS